MKFVVQYQYLKKFNVMFDKNDRSAVLIKKTLMVLNNFFNLYLIRQLPSFSALWKRVAIYRFNNLFNDISEKDSIPLRRIIIFCVILMNETICAVYYTIFFYLIFKEHISYCFKKRKYITRTFNWNAKIRDFLSWRSDDVQSDFQILDPQNFQWLTLAWITDIPYRNLLSQPRSWAQST